MAARVCLHVREVAELRPRGARGHPFPELLYAEKLEKFLRDQKDPRMLGNGDVFGHYEYLGSEAKKAKKAKGAKLKPSE